MLDTLPICFIDCQSTGANPATSELLELSCDDRAYFVATTKPISKKIQSLTGIKLEDIADAVTPEELTAVIEAYLAAKNPRWIVAHFARFEKTMLDRLWQEHRGMPFPIPFICTHKLAKLLHADLPSYGLRAVAGWYGDPIHEHKRAQDHVDATKIIWQRMVLELKERGVVDEASLLAFISEKPKKSTTRKSYHIDRERRLALPNQPGIYRYIARNGRILYVGKATSLKHRVNCYFTGGLKRDARKREMLAQAVEVDVTPLPSPLHAGMQEYDEIQHHQPPYNKMFRGEASTLESDLQVLVKDPATLDQDDLATAKRHLFYGIDELDVLRDGLKMWREQIPPQKQESWTYRTLILLGLPLLKIWIAEEKQRRIDAELAAEANEIEDAIEIENEIDDGEEGTDTTEEDVEFVWTADLVAAEAHAWTRRAARDYLKRRYLRRLQGAIIDRPDRNITYEVSAHQDHRRAKVLLHELRRAESKGEPWQIVKPWPMHIPFWV